MNINISIFILAHKQFSNKMKQISNNMLKSKQRISFYNHANFCDINMFRYDFDVYPRLISVISYLMFNICLGNMCYKSNLFKRNFSFIEIINDK